MVCGPERSPFQRMCEFSSLMDAHYRCRLGKRHQRSLCDQVLAPFLDKRLVYDNAASRKGKGTHFALDRLSGFLRAHYREHGTAGYFLKFDVRKYFESIDHEILLRLLERCFGDDAQLMRLMRLSVNGFHGDTGKGLPLGNQSSQWFALYYLDGLDRLIKEKHRVKRYTRYMDDGVIVHHDRAFLENLLEEMRRYLREERKLEFNSKTQIVPISQGIDYLGFHVYLTDSGKVVRKLRASGKRRLKRRLKRFKHAYAVGKISEAAIDESLQSYCAHLSHGNCDGLKRQIRRYRGTFRRSL